jgi:hypothetical protein
MDTFHYQISVESEINLIRIRCEGILGLHSAQKMVAEARELALECRLPLIYDFRLLQLPRRVPLAIVANFPMLAGLPLGAETLRSAAIIAAEQVGNDVWESYRLASRRSGMHWNYFTSEAEALSWLRDRNHWNIQRGYP